MNPRFILLLCLVLAFGDSIAQARKVTGVIVDAETKTPLKNVTILLEETTDPVLSSEKGAFEVTIFDPYEQDRLTVTHIGFKPVEFRLNLNNHIRIPMKREATELKKIFLGQFPATEFEYISSQGERPKESPAEYLRGLDNFGLYIGNGIFRDAINANAPFEITFTIDENGKAKNVGITSGGSGIKSTIERLLSEMPPWIPAKQNGSSVTQSFRLPVIPVMPEEISQAGASVELRKLTGRILDSKTQKPIRNAVIQIPGRTTVITTNVLGFFEATIKPGESLVASHIGYNRVAFHAPAENKFNIVLEREYERLGSLILSDYSGGATRSTSGISVPVADSPVETVATFPNGVIPFFNYVGNSLYSKNVIPVNRSFEVTFTIDITGKPIDIVVSDSTVSNVVKVVFQNMPAWSSAVQAGVKVPQHFSVTIYDAVPQVTAFDTYVSENAKIKDIYPGGTGAGTVLVNFKVLKDGTVDSIKTVNEVWDYSVGAERLLRDLPKDLGLLLLDQTGVSHFTLPITFKIVGGLNVPSSTARSGSYLLKELVVFVQPGRNISITSFDVSSLQDSSSNGKLDLTRVMDALVDSEAFSNVEAIMEQPGRVRKVAMRNKSLTFIPTEIFSCKNLESLDLENNQIPSVPQIIGSLSNLRWLFLMGNKIGELPMNISKLEKLSALSLANNSLSSFPASVLALGRLKQLDLTNNKIAELPSAIGQLQSLELLALGNLGLTSLPPQFFTLKKLKKIILTGNQFDSETIYRLKTVFKKAELVF